MLVCALALLGGCTAAPSPAPAAELSTSAQAPVSKRPGKLPPVPGSDEGRPTAPPPGTAPVDDEGFTRSCGAVTAASGAQLQVYLGEGVTSCPAAERLVREFHRVIAGKQPSGSRRPAAAVVDGWDCVSGPPSSQGGTICTRDGATVSAGIVPAE